MALIKGVGGRIKKTFTQSILCLVQIRCEELFEHWANHGIIGEYLEKRSMPDSGIGEW